MRYETVRRKLSHLTDRELADIGIARSDIERVASGEARVQPLLFFPGERHACRLGHW
jgi:hypothetical protein